jgi:hypothetical protein
MVKIGFIGDPPSAPPYQALNEGGMGPHPSRPIQSIGWRIIRLNQYRYKALMGGYGCLPVTALLPKINFDY